MASRLWSPDAARARYVPVQGLKGKAAIEAAQNKRAANEIHSLLFPKDD